MVGGLSIQVVRAVTVMRTTMRSRYGRLLAPALVFVLAGCAEERGGHRDGSGEHHWNAQETLRRSPVGIPSVRHSAGLGRTS